MATNKVVPVSEGSAAEVSSAEEVREWGAVKKERKTLRKAKNIVRRTSTLYRLHTHPDHVELLAADSGTVSTRPPFSVLDRRAHVSAHLTMKKIRGLDVLRSSADLRFILVLEWVNRRLINKKVDCDRLWTPSIDILNADSLTKTAHKPWFYPANGLVRQIIEFEGTVAHESEFHNFPFESGTIKIILICELDTGDDIVKLNYLRGKKTSDVAPAFLDKQVTEFGIEHSLTHVYRLPPPPHNNRFHLYGQETAIVFDIHINRHFWFYIWKIMLILSMLSILSWMVFFMDEFMDRMEISLGLFLAATTFLYIASENMPKLPYLTTLDKMVLGCFFNLFAGACETFLVMKVIKTDEMRAAVDHQSKIWFPLSFFLIIGGLMFRSIYLRRQDLQKRKESCGIDYDLFGELYDKYDNSQGSVDKVLS
jgi:hypothetical protein